MAVRAGRRVKGIFALLVAACTVAESADAVAANLVVNPYFEATGSAWLSPWAFDVRSGAAGTIAQASSTVDGSFAAQSPVTQSSPSSPWLVPLSQGRLALTAGRTYTMSFSARASAARKIDVQL